MRTGFGDLIFIYNIDNKDKEYRHLDIETVDIRHCEINNIAIGLERFFENYLLNIGRLCAQTNIDLMVFFNSYDKFVTNLSARAFLNLTLKLSLKNICMKSMMTRLITTMKLSKRLNITCRMLY